MALSISVPDNSIYEIEDGKAYADHDPDSEMDYPFNWAPWLAQLGNDTITQVIPVFDASMSPGANGVQFDSTHVVIWAKGGMPKKTLPLTCRIKTAAGRTYDQTVYLRIREN